MEKKSIPIKAALMPAFYKDFHCLAEKCRDSCCKGWRIEFDKNDFLRLRRVEASEEFKSRLDAAVKRLRGEASHGKMFGKFQLENGSCPLLEECGLCSLQLNCGGDALPTVCKVFPRQTRYTTAARESSLTLGCEGVLNLLWDLHDGIEFVAEELPPKERRTLHIQAGDNLIALFPDIRSLCVDILQARQLPLSSRMLFMGIALRDLADHHWSEQGAAEWLRQTEERLREPELAGVLEELPGDRVRYLLQNVQVAAKLAAENNPFAEVLLNAAGLKCQGEWSINKGVYEKELEQFQQSFGDLEYFFENIMVSLLLQCEFPDLSSGESLWKGYVNLCNLYSFYRFAAVTGCAEEATKERLIHILVMVGRALLHNNVRQQKLRDEFFKNDSASIAHMAILLCG